MYYVGLDVAKLKTQVCIIDDQKKIIRETKVDTHPEAIALYLYDQKLEYERIGLETGTMSTWIHAGLRRASLPVMLIDARQAHAYLKNSINKNDKNDARGIARLMRNDELPAVHAKSEESQNIRVLLKSRKVALQKKTSIELSVRGMLRNMGLTLPTSVGDTKYEGLVNELIEFDRPLRRRIEPLLGFRRDAMGYVDEYDRQVKEAALDDRVCRLLMTAPGIGPIGALTYRATIDDPTRFKNSRSVAACLGLTARQYQSGEVDNSGRISKMGDIDARTAMVNAGLFIVHRDKREYALKTWADAKKPVIGGGKTCSAVGRKLSVILHQMWISGETFRFGK